MLAAHPDPHGILEFQLHFAGIENLVNAAREAGRPAVLLKVIDQRGGSHFLAVRLN